MTEHQVIQRSIQHEPYRFTQRDYLLLAQNGAFEGIAKAELIEGVIYAANAQFSRHVRLQSRLYRLLADACDRLDGKLDAWIEGSISVNGGTMPQPDIFVARELPEEGPIPADRVALAVEVADTSLDHDLGAKATAYATAGVPEYWVVDANARIVHRLTEPNREGYARRSSVKFGEELTAVTINGLGLTTASL